MSVRKAVEFDPGGGREEMWYTCGKCGQMQMIGPFAQLGLDPEEPHRIWDVLCVHCGFSGKSRVSAHVWAKLVDESRCAEWRPFGVGLSWRLKLGGGRRRAEALLEGEAA
jgi:hypothetical protein